MLTCPHCGSANVRRSRSRNAGGGRFLLHVWFRCRSCSSAFRRVDRAKIGALAAAVALCAAGVWALRATPPSPRDAAPPAPAFGAGSETPASLLPEDALREAAQQGDSDARCRLGLSLLQDYRVTGGQAALDEALRWLKAAAEAGDPRAQLQLGIMHHEGQGLIEDFPEAARWFRLAARGGSSQAMVRLGGMALEGEGGSKDLVEAYVWLNLAAARGERAADEARDRVRSLLDEGQLARAQERSRALDREVPRASAP